MTASPHYDVAIVGASIAGCTAATLFARRGLKVALIEREADPNAYKKVCTHFIQPSATPTIERLGLAGSIEAAGGIRNGIDLWSRWGWIRGSLDKDYPYPTYGYNIRRQKLDPMVRTLEQYRKKHRAALSGHHFLIADFASGRGFNLIEKLMFMAATKDEQAARHFAAFGCRSIGVSQFLAPTAIARAIWVNIRPRSDGMRRRTSLAQTSRATAKAV